MRLILICWCVLLACASPAQPVLSGLLSSGVIASSPPPTPDILWWKLNEGSGTALSSSATDTSHGGTTVADWITGKSGSGGALDFVPGNSDYANTTNTIAFSTNLATVCFWAWFDSTTGTKVIFESSANYNSTVGAFLIYTDAGNFIASVAQDASTKYWTETIAAPATGAWVHIAVVLDTTTGSSRLGVYFDGAAQATTPTSNRDAGVTLGTATLYVAARNAGNFFIDGRLDDIRIYSGDRSANLAAIIADPQ